MADPPPAQPDRFTSTPAQVRFYRFARLVVAGFCYTFWRTTVTGRENIPRSGAFILAPVHRSFIDTVLCGTMTRRRLRYMAGDGYLRNRLLGWLLTSLGGFPVRQFSADREALRLCQALLSSGQPVVMFPEGTRRSGPVLGDVFGGVAFLAQRTGVPIIPVGIGGSERAMPRGKKTLRPVKIAIVIGKPIAPLGVSAPGARAPHGGSRRAAIELTERLRAELQGVTDLAMAATARPHRQELGRQEPGRQEPGR